MVIMQRDIKLHRTSVGQSVSEWEEDFPPRRIRREASGRLVICESTSEKAEDSKMGKSRVEGREKELKVESLTGNDYM